MPRNQNVYGKRRKGANAFLSSRTYSWSPAKLATAKTAEDDLRDEDEEASLVTEKLAGLSLEGVVKKNSRALKKKDGNAVKKAVDVLEVDEVCKSAKVSETNCLGPISLARSRQQQKDSKNLSSIKPLECDRESANLATTTYLPANKTTASKTSQSTRKSLPSSPDIRKRALLNATTKITTTQPTDDSTPPSNHYTYPLLQLCNDPSGRISPTPFSTWSSSLEEHLTITKIAEASYGEVYRLAPRSPVPGFTRSDESVLKMIALKPQHPPPPAAPPLRNRASRVADKRTAERLAAMSAVENVVSEVRLLQRMTATPGFTNFREVRVLQGRPSRAFAEAWTRFNRSRPRGEKSTFADPARKASYDEGQLWAVIEMQDAGADLERVRIADVWGVWDVFWGVAVALGKGEEEARFEHRDLHLGNICVKLAGTSTATTDYSVRNTRSKLGFTGLESTIIDYTLSRAEMISSHEDSSAEDERVAFLDLEQDPALFDGDGEEDYQYDMYRYMRAAMYLSDPHADLSTLWDDALASGRTWRGFHPQTNVVWLHFVLLKLLETMEWPSRDADLALARVAESEERPQALERARWLEDALLELKSLFDLARFRESGLSSTRDLIGMALTKGWLDEGDVIGSAATLESSLTSDGESQRN